MNERVAKITTDNHPPPDVVSRSLARKAGRP